MDDIEKIKDLINKEQNRQENEICLIASENYMSKDVMEANGSILINKYAEGYPSKRYYGGCEIVDEIEQIAIDEAKELFNCKYANVQPHSGSQANQAVYLALCEPGDTILGMDLNSGGHLTHGSKVSSSGKLYNSVSYGLDENGIINYNEIKEKLYEYNPRLLIVGASAYPREIDFKKIREIVDEYNKWAEDCKKFNEERSKRGEPVGLIFGKKSNEKSVFPESCYFMVDMAHIAGLVAASEHMSPLPYADVVTSTTQKTLRSGRGGIILTNDEEISKKIDKSVFPGIQGGPLEHIIAGKAIGFAEALKPEFKQYIHQVKKNVQAMVEVFRETSVKMISGGSDNHLILIDLKDEKFSGKDLEIALEKMGIITNKNAVQNDPKSKSETSGLRIGTACITTRGANEDDSHQIAIMIAGTIDYLRNQGGIPDAWYIFVRNFVKEWCGEHPIYK